MLAWATDRNSSLSSEYSRPLDSAITDEVRGTLFSSAISPKDSFFPSVAMTLPAPPGAPLMTWNEPSDMM